jgi:hypothetical protein
MEVRPGISAEVRCKTETYAPHFATKVPSSTDPPSYPVARAVSVRLTCHVSLT